MSAHVGLVFSKQVGEDATAARLEQQTAELASAPGVLAARRFRVNVVLGDRPPAFYPDLVMCQLDGVVDDADAVTTAIDILGSATGSASADELPVVAWGGVSVGPRNDFELPDHLYLQFSAPPESMPFDEYSDWYQVHQDENIAQSVVLRRGWRYRLEPRAVAVAPGPAHLAVYELKGALEKLTADLGRAMDAGVISLPDWFTRFASLEAIALGPRVTG